MTQDFGRMLDKTHQPTEEEIVNYIGEAATEVWLEIRQFLEEYYDFVPETVFYGTKYGWTIRYRKSGKTLCSFFPEKGGFTLLITFGKKEAEKALSLREELSAKVRTHLENAKQLRDGRWLWIRVIDASDTPDIKKLVQIKQKPKRK
ncbi:MAG: DUF3788 domain-containing protein [Candidatus Hodarchaeales archaeon]|jgi:hypothetical protein